MSFCAECKEEIMQTSEFDNCCLNSHLYGFLCFFPRISTNELSISSENIEVLNYLISLMNQNGINIGYEDIIKGRRLNTLKCTDHDICERVISDYFLNGNRLQIQINKDFFRCMNCAKAFISGAFLAAGVITEPEKGYHFEIATHRQQIADGLASLLVEQGFEVKQANRGYDKLIYVKNSSQIEDILTYIGAPLCSMKLMEAKIVRDVRNQVTRRVNCENANMEKAIASAYQDINLFERFFENGGKKLLSNDLIVVADSRIDNPELSLNELAEMIGDGLTKSGISHRLRRIREIARTFLEEND